MWNYWGHTLFISDIQLGTLMSLNWWLGVSLGCLWWDLSINPLVPLMHTLVHIPARILDATCATCAMADDSSGFPPSPGCALPSRSCPSDLFEGVWEGLVCHRAQYGHWPLCLSDPSLSISLPALKVNDSQLFPGRARGCGVVRHTMHHSPRVCPVSQLVTRVRMGTRGCSRHLQLVGHGENCWQKIKNEQLFMKVEWYVKETQKLCDFNLLLFDSKNVFIFSQMSLVLFGRQFYLKQPIQCI